MVPLLGSRMDFKIWTNPNKNGAANIKYFEQEVYLGFDRRYISGMPTDISIKMCGFC